MSGQATTTATPQTYWGNSNAENRVRPGGDLGNRQYWYQTEVSTGNISVHRYMPGGQIVGPISTKIGTIRPGGRFEVSSQSDGTPIANTAEILHYSENSSLNAARLQAEKVATKTWDGKTQPSPSNSINRDWTAAKDPTELGADAIENPLTPPTPPPGGWDTAKEKKNSLVKAKKSNTSLGAGETLVYPQTLRQEGSNSQDRIKLQMLEYAPKSFGLSQGQLSGVGPRPKNRKGLGSVYLPIPGGIMDSNTVSWGSDSMSAVDIGVASLALSLLQDDMEKTKTKLSSGMGAAAAGAEEIKQAMGSAFAGMAAGKAGGQQILQRTEGAILNPNMELLFNNPALRQFNFSWKLAPRSADEAKEVIQIIRFFKQGMAPIRQEPNLFLKSPNTFQLTYKHKASDHKFLNKFKECALLNCGVQYTPDGNYATYEDGVMTAYQMTLSFQELDPVYSDDYEGISNTEIGF